MSASVALRIGTRDDWPHVFDSFAREYGRTSQGKPFGERLMRRALERLLSSPRWTLTIAAPLTGGDEIYGWMLRSGRDIAWLHVKDFWRGHGFARELIAHSGCSGNCGTPFSPSAEAMKFAEANGLIIRARPHLLIREALVA